MLTNEDIEVLKGFQTISLTSSYDEIIEQSAICIKSFENAANIGNT